MKDEDHRLIAEWAVKCAAHALRYFESEEPEDNRPRKALEAAMAWVHGEITVDEAKRWTWETGNSARGKLGAAKYAALSAGQAAAVAHVAAHGLGAAAYAIRAVMAASDETARVEAGTIECRWQRDQLPETIRELVIEDQKNRNEICWNVFT